MKNIIIWGTGKEYTTHVRRVQCGVAAGEFHVVGVTSNDCWYHTLDGFPFLSKQELMDVPHDIVLVTSKRYFSEIQAEYVKMGGDAENVFPIGVLDVANLTLSQVVEIHQSKISIVANNCWGGVTYHSLHMKFLSPFINLFIRDADYLALLCDFHHRIRQPLVYAGADDDEVSHLHYPIFSLGGTHLHMNHAEDPEERMSAAKKWEERLQRLNEDNLLFMMWTESEEAADQFDALPLKRKICFTSFPTDLPSCMYAIPYVSYNKARGKPFWETVNGMAKGVYPFYDIYELLMHGEKRYRTV